jgi:hypothetical protein
MSGFNAMVCNKLSYYVYTLADPRGNGSRLDKVFYVGKGKGNRCFNHAREERGSEDALLREDEHKLGIIQEIRQQGLEVEILIVVHALSEEEALRTEAVLIPLIGDANKHAGHGDEGLWLSKAQVEQLYDKPVQRYGVQEFRDNTLFVSLNQQDIDALLIDDRAMAEATLGDWNVSEAKSYKVDLIVGVKNSLVVSIFKIEKNDNFKSSFRRIAAKAKGKHGRSRFTGQRIQNLEAKFKGRSILQDGKIITKILPGAGCRYIEAI